LNIEIQEALNACRRALAASAQLGVKGRAFQRPLQAAVGALQSTPRQDPKWRAADQDLVPEEDRISAHRARYVARKAARDLERKEARKAAREDAAKQAAAKGPAAGGN